MLGSVLYIAAHPDDENTRLLSWLSKDRLYRTGYLSITRGDGGQNLVGDEQGIALGLLRTQELLAARRIDGAEQFFTRAYDFGFSKNPQETFAKWNKEKILADVVWIIRKFQPDVIITRFPTTGEGGHGHHTASAILANEAFTAAADPKRFPEQLSFVKPWMAKRIMLNGFNFGGGTVKTDNQLKIDVGGYNPVLGKSYGEIAAESRSQHKSQGFGATRNRGEALEYLATTGGQAPENDLMDNIDLSWKRVAGGEAIGNLIETTIRNFDYLQPQKSLPQLVQIYKTIRSLPEGYWKNQKLKEVQQLVEQASGIWAEAFTTEQAVAQTDSVRVSFSINDRLGTNLRLNNIRIDKWDTAFNRNLEKNKNLAFTKSIFITADKPITQPYWLQHKMEEGSFNVNDQQLIGEADIQPAYMVSFSVNIEGESFVFEKPVRCKSTHPVKGELYQPFVVIPYFTVDVPKEVNLVKLTDKPTQQFIYTAQKNVSGLQIFEDKNTLVKDTSLLRKGTSRQFESVLNKAITASGNVFSLSYYEQPLKVNAKTIHRISYDHIPTIHYFTNAANKYLVLDVKTTGKKIGYIVGAGDKVPEALEQMGYEVTLLTDKELSRNSLEQFDAVITGIRAYNTNEWMNTYYDKLMKYVEGGGNLIVQYNTSSGIGPVRAKIGPYPFNISRSRITDENAAVSFLKPDHAVLNFPNKITENDFRGWIQERSIYHASDISQHFETILRMNDPGEQPDDGSLIIARHGKGYFTYTGLVFFRELPAGVPGTYRLLANIISLNNTKTY